MVALHAAWRCRVGARLACGALFMPVGVVLAGCATVVEALIIAARAVAGPFVLEERRRRTDGLLLLGDLDQGVVIVASGGVGIIHIIMGVVIHIIGGVGIIHIIIGVVLVGVSGVGIHINVHGIKMAMVALHAAWRCRVGARLACGALFIPVGVVLAGCAAEVEALIVAACAVAGPVVLEERRGRTDGVVVTEGVGTDRTHG